MADASSVRIETRAAGVTALILDRPAKMNALHGPTIAALHEAVRRLDADGSVRAVLLEGAGPHFSAGGDLDWMGARDADALSAYHGEVIALMGDLVGLSKPMVASVRGACAGGAVGLALAADYVVAANDARFSVQFLRIGLVPDCALPLLLTRRCGAQRARRLVFDDRRVTSSEALAWGMVDELCDGERLDEVALALAKRLAAMPPLAFARTKWLMQRTEQALEQLLEDERSAQADCLGGREFAEGCAAFLARRPPCFD